MMEDFKKLLMQKVKSQEGKPKNERKLRAKASMAKELSEMLGSDLTDDIKGAVKKVTIASDSEEGIKKGLEKAEDILEGNEEESESEDSDSESPEDIEMKIEELEGQLEELKRQLEDIKSKR
jgi:hypothetical protein